MGTIIIDDFPVWPRQSKKWPLTSFKTWLTRRYTGRPWGDFNLCSPHISDELYCGSSCRGSSTILYQNKCSEHLFIYHSLFEHLQSFHKVRVLTCLILFGEYWVSLLELTGVISLLVSVELSRQSSLHWQTLKSQSLSFQLINQIMSW